MKTPSLKRNFILNAFLTVSSMLFPLITFPYVSRILLPTGTGKVAFATSFISYFALFSQLGIPTYGIRACAKVRDNKLELTRTAQELLIINLVMSMGAYAVLLLIITVVPRFQEEQTLYLVISSSILCNALGMEWLYKSLEQYTYITVRSLVFKLMALAGVFLLIQERSDYVIYGAMTVFATSASGIMNFLHVHQHISLRPVGGYHFCKHLKAVAIFFAMSCAVSIYTHIDSTMLGLIISDEAVGNYDAAVKVRTAILGLVTSLGAVILPRSAYYIQQGKYDEFRRVSNKATHFVLLLAAPITVFFIMFAQPCVYLLSGRAYHDAILPLQIILPTVLLVGITNIWGIQMLIPLGRETVVLYSEIAGAIIDLVINALLIPICGISGAAIGTLAAEAVVLVVQFMDLKEKARETLAGIEYYKIGSALLLAAAASFWINLVDLTPFVCLVFAACVFWSLYGVILLYTREKLSLEIFGLVRTYITCLLPGEKNK